MNIRNVSDIMNIIDNIIEFKSIPEYYDKEISGKKPNTVRFITDKKEYWLLKKKKRNLKYIRIYNARTKENFLRELTDISVFENTCYIFSWKHE